MNHRKLRETYFGPIPIDNQGRTYEIHHINNDHFDNRIENLKLVTIEEHFEIHATQEDWGAYTMIAHRMGLPIDFCSKIQQGKKRPGIGGAPKGRVPWNKGKGGYKLNCDRRGRRFTPGKYSIEDIKFIRKLYNEKYKFDEYITYINNTFQRPNGKLPIYERFISREIIKEYFKNNTSIGIYNIIMGYSWKEVLL